MADVPEKRDTRFDLWLRLAPERAGTEPQITRAKRDVGQYVTCWRVLWQRRYVSAEHGVVDVITKREVALAMLADTCCPWCGSDEPPVATDPAVANFQYGRADDPTHIARNPVMCPQCYGVGKFTDWG